jgi:hypothetical protein
MSTRFDETLYQYPDELIVARKGGLVRSGPDQFDAFARRTAQAWT